MARYKAPGEQAADHVQLLVTTTRMIGIFTFQAQLETSNNTVCTSLNLQNTTEKQPVDPEVFMQSLRQL